MSLLTVVNMAEARPNLGNKQNFLKLRTFLRSTMTQPRLNALMLMYVHRDLTESMDLTDIAKSFISVNDRRFYLDFMISYKWGQFRDDNYIVFWVTKIFTVKISP